MSTMPLYNGAPGSQPAQIGNEQSRGLMLAGMLQMTLQVKRIQALVSLAHDGPQIWTFAVLLPFGDEPAKVRRLADALALAAGADGCRVAKAGAQLLLEIPKPRPMRRPLPAAALDTLKTPGPLAVPLGVTTNGEVAWLDIADERTCHLAVGGTTGSGKTVALQWLIYRLLRQNSPQALRLLMVDPKGQELTPFARVPHLLHPTAAKPLEAARVLAWVSAEIDRRSAGGISRPRVLMVLDEVRDLVKANPDVAPLMARIAQIGRALGVHLVASTQQPGADSFGGSVANFPARLLGRVASATLTYGAAGRGQTAADQLIGRGDFLLITGDGETRVQLPLIDGRQFGQLPRVETPATLDGEMPAAALYADRARDPRGGRGRRELTPDDYRRIDQMLAEGAGTEDLRAEFGIGYERAARLVAARRDQ